MNYQVITISREYGTHGHTVAGELSQRLGLPYYDKDFVKKTAADSGYEIDMIQREGETLSQGAKWLQSLISSNSPVSYSSSYDEIFRAQSKVILDLSRKPCIIVGRCANYVLRQAGIPSFDIFLYADKQWREKNAMDISDTGYQNAAQFIAKQDASRRNYYKTYTGTEMGNAENYNISLDIGVIGLEKSVDLLTDLLKRA